MSSSESASDRDDTHDVSPSGEGTSDTSGRGKKVITRLSRARKAQRRVVPLGRYLPKPNTNDGSSSSSSSAPLPVTVGREDLRPTHVEDGRVIVVPQEDSFLPSKPAATAVVNSIQQNLKKGWKNWTAVKKDKDPHHNYFKEMLDSFLEQCTWLPEEQEAVEYAFNKRCSDRYSELMRGARRLGRKPDYMGPEAYRDLETYWKSDEFKNKQDKAKKNRASERGCCIHAGGSVSAGTHHQRMEEELGRPVSLPELHRNLYMREEDGSYVNPRARMIQEAFDAGMAEWRESQQQSGCSSIDPVEESRVARSIWDRAVGPQKSDRLTGSGSMGPKIFKETILPRRSHSGSESTGRSYVAPNYSVDELTQQFNQRFNEQAEQYARQLQEVEERAAERTRIAEERAAEQARRLEERAAEQARRMEERAAEQARRMEERMQQMMGLMNPSSRPSSSSSSSHMASYQPQQVMGGSFQPWPHQSYPQQYPPSHYSQQYDPSQQQYRPLQQQYPPLQQQYPPLPPQQQYPPRQQFPDPTQQQSPPPFNNIDLNFTYDALAATLMGDDFQPPPGGSYYHRDEEDDHTSQ